MPRLPMLVLALALVATALGCKEVPSFEGGVGSDNEGCGFEGTNSVILGDSTCACEAGYEWCTDELLDFECCPLDDPSTGDTDSQAGGLPPEEDCGAEQLEQLSCVPDPDDDSPGAAMVWACNGERWVEVPGYAKFACAAQGRPFAYGCVPGPEFLCGFGPGSPCDTDTYLGICIDEDIIDTCVWGRRTVDRCTRLCAEVGAFGQGFSTGRCESPWSKAEPAVCVCE